ncbi:helix-turn-helix transcriptional regulator [Mycobacteroides abscessus]|uniref:helix-turn-helix transcriptional regulator n=1 Tax=Mycobacteroides abscessus TaxID=36809 RepID=UPI000C268CDB|nr:helix-turn-helix transcriptional regulator [Mycobacteroides abscessus]
MNLDEFGHFLRARRNRLAPQTASASQLVSRRVPGLRREEVAVAAAISTDYYTKLEQGRASAPSPQVLDALALVLQWSASERKYADLLLATRLPAGAQQPPDVALHRLVLAHRAGPAYLLDHRLNFIAVNDIAVEWFFRAHPISPGDTNLVRWIFATEAARKTFRHWRRRADQTVATLRLCMARRPSDPYFAALVTELFSVPAFARLWTLHNVRAVDSAPEQIYLPSGELTTQHYVTFPVPSDAITQITLYWGD